jgi:hypothetical protein
MDIHLHCKFISRKLKYLRQLGNKLQPKQFLQSKNMFACNKYNIAILSRALWGTGKTFMLK